MLQIVPSLDAGGAERTTIDIARALRDEERVVLKEIKQVVGRDVTVRPDALLHHEQFDVMAIG